MADTKITGLTENTTPVSTDLVPVVDDPGGTPETQKSTIANFTKGLDAAQIKTLYEGNADTNAYDDAAVTKLAGIETSATADQTGAEIKVAYEGEANTNAFTDAEQTKLSGIATSATANPNAIDNVLEDTTPQLGGDLDLNSNDITGTGNINTTGDIDISGDIDAGSGQIRAVNVNSETASFTFALVDAGKHTTINNAGATTATIPPNSSVAFPTGTILVLEQIGAGACTWTEGAGVTINTKSNQSAVTNGQRAVSVARKTATDTWTVTGDLVTDTQLESWVIPISNQTEDLTTGTSKFTFRAPYAFTITDIRASVATAPTGSTIIIDVNDGGTSIMTTNKLTIDATEKTTETAATAPTLTDTAFADDAEISIDIDQVGSTVAGQGAVVTIIGRQT